MTIASGSAFATIHSTSAVLSRAPRRPRAGQPRIPFLCPAVGQPRRQAKCGRRRHAAPAAHFDRAFVQRCVAYRSLSCANQGRGALPRLVPSKEQLFPRSAAEQNRPNSASWSVRCGRPNRACISPRPSAAASATPTFSSPASASRMRALCWRSRPPSWSELIARSTNYGPAIGLEESQAKATRGKTASTGRSMAGPASKGLRLGEPARTGKLSWPAQGRTANVSARGVTAGETAPSFVSLNSFSDIGSARETSAMLHPGVVDGPTTSLAGRDSGDRAERRSNNFVQGRAARSTHVAHNHKVVSSNLTPATSSGDGLGIHQPGSMTRGFALLRQPPSGRARVRAKCPAVARSFAGRAA